MKGLALFSCKAQGLVVAVEVELDFLVLSFSLLEELSDAFLAKRAIPIAGQPANETTTGIAINNPTIFTNLFINLSPLISTMQRKTICRSADLSTLFA